MLKNHLLLLLAVILCEGINYGQDSINVDNKNADILEIIAAYDKIPWQGEFELYLIKFQYKKYPVFIDALKYTTKDIPIKYDGSPLYFLLSNIALINSPNLETDKLHDSFYQYCDQPQKYKEFLQKTITNADSEKELFEAIRKSILMKYCIGEVKAGNFHAILTIDQFPIKDINRREYDFFPIVYKDGRFYVEFSADEDPAFNKFTACVDYSLRDKEQLARVFRLKNKKFPVEHTVTPELWRGWCNKSRTKAFLGSLESFNEKYVSIRLYTTKKIIKGKREKISKEDNDFLDVLSEYMK